MSTYINTNIVSLNAQNNLAKSQSSLATSIQRLSSGLRINTAADDAAGYSISQRMTAQINGSSQATRNANDAISMTQTAGGDLSSISDNLQSMRTLAVQAANGSNSASDRASINAQVQSLSAEINRVAMGSSFNGNNLLDGSLSGGTNFQVGANGTANDSITVAIASATTTALGGVGTSSQASTTGAVTTAAALVAGNVTLNGFQVGASVAGAAAGQSAGSAFAKAAAINQVAAQSGVTATAVAATVTGVAGASTALAAANSISVNGVNVGAIAAGGSAVGQGANTAAAINSVSAQTGVTATADNLGKVTLSAADGRDISLLAQGTTTAAAALTALGLVTGDVAGPVAAVVTTGKITLNSTNAAGIVIDGGGVAAAGLTAGTTAPSTTSTGNTIASINVSTIAGATSALAAIDGALAEVNASQASLGAYQNRFTSVVTNLASTGENLTASRSRIQDTDFASETASLTRGQILQQAGTAMLAQANSLPNGVMALLR